MVVKEGVFIFKKFLYLFILLSIVSTSRIVKAESHPDFKEITFPYGEMGSLIEDMDEQFINTAYKKVKRKLFGWNISKITIDDRINFVGDTVFSKANNTNYPLNFTHSFEIENKMESSVSVSGDIGISFNAKGKILSGGLEAVVRKEVEKKEIQTIVETTRASLYIPSKTKLSITIKGTAVLNNGVAKYYFLGIGFKKGTWEYIDVLTEFYDYYEEEI